MEYKKSNRQNLAYMTKKYAFNGLFSGKIAKGTIGALSWILTTEGTLNIKSAGPIMDFSSPLDYPAWLSYSCREKIKNVVIGNGITAIGANAFWECYHLESIKIPSSVTSIGEAAFYQCYRLKSIVIPNSVQIIRESAFSKSGLESISIPNSVRSLGKYAFYESNLKSVILAGCNLTNFEEGAFTSCKELSSVVIEHGVTFIADQAFSSCYDLQSIIIPDSVKSIGNFAFGSCKNFKSITIPNGVKTIEDSTFFSSGIESVIIPENVKSIGKQAFFFCHGLKSVVIPNGVKIIGEEAFEHCSLTSIVIPDSVTNIEDCAFNNCNLENIQVLWNKPININSNVFSEDIFNKCMLHVPSGTMALYAIADVWKEFIIIEINCNKDNKKTGTCRWPNGAVYIGDIKNGKINGEGIMTWQNGAKYVGQFQDGKRNGKGTQIWSSGQKYIGNFVNNKCNGLGTMIMPNGEKYEGQYKDDVFIDNAIVERTITNNENMFDKKEFYLFFDTETTGLPKDWNASVNDVENWPRLVQLAYLVYDDEGNKKNSGNFIAKPDGFTIPIDVSILHGVTTERAEREGQPILSVLQAFEKLVHQANYIVAHNISFDEKVVGSEFIRNGMMNPFNGKNKICTMERTTDFCAIQSPYGDYKYPKLSELYYKLFGTYFEEAHNAAADINATAKCFWELRRIGKI